MKFQVPQFIETETKIIGPFTLKQFLWVAGGMAVIFFSFLVLPFSIFLVVAFISAAFFGSLAFVKLDGVPLFNYLVYIIGYALNPRKYYFKKGESEEEILKKEVSEEIAKKSSGKPKRGIATPKSRKEKEKEQVGMREDDSISEEIVVSGPENDLSKILDEEKEEKAMEEIRGSH